MQVYTIRYYESFKVKIAIMKSKEDFSTPNTAKAQALLLGILNIAIVEALVTGRGPTTMI